MSATLNFFKTLEISLNKYCKVVYRDGGGNSPAKAFYGVLIAFDPKFQTWEGDNVKGSSRKLTVTFNHDDVNRIVMELGGGVGA